MSMLDLTIKAVLGMLQCPARHQQCCTVSIINVSNAHNDEATSRSETDGGLGIKWTDLDSIAPVLQVLIYALCGNRTNTTPACTT